MKKELTSLDTIDVQSRLLELRGQRVLLDRDVAVLYGVQTREINQAIRNNPDKFPAGYVFDLDEDETEALRSKILIFDGKKPGRGQHSKHGYKALTERGLYMLATILKGDRAVKTTLAIIETYARLRAMVRDMETLQTLKDGSSEQAEKLSAAGHKLAALIGDNLSTESTKTTIELNLAVLKITHEVSRSKRRN
ncbi:MAG: ORF6N domain-containing protein [Kiritimatiellae bacterium]|nr:ORF6N domain-containing protein [Kiritimatiellia bacterium]